MFTSSSPNGCVRFFFKKRYIVGVHLKALETYRQVFDILGPQLPKMLYLFACGLFPLMDHCGIKVIFLIFFTFEYLGENRIVQSF